MGETFTLPRLIICEGPEDKAFFQRLIEERKLSKFHVSARTHKDSQ